MDINRWREVAASNNFAVPDGAPENWLGGEVNAWGRELMAAIYRYYEYPEWLEITYARPVYGAKVLSKLSDTSFRIANCDARFTNSGKPGFQVGRRIRIRDGSTMYYGFVVSEFTSTHTDVTVILDSGVVPASISEVNVHHSFLGRPAHITTLGTNGQVLRSNGSAVAWADQQPPIGTICVWPTAAPPSGWLLCDGTAVSRATYATLFALIGTVFGVGDGATTFNLPNCKGRVVVGQDTGGGNPEFDVIGETGGAKTVSSGGPSSTVSRDTGGAVTVASSGHTHSASTLQPYITMNWIIKASL